LRLFKLINLIEFPLCCRLQPVFKIDWSIVWAKSSLILAWRFHLSVGEKRI